MEKLSSWPVVLWVILIVWALSVLGIYEPNSEYAQQHPARYSNEWFDE